MNKGRRFPSTLKIITSCLAVTVLTGWVLSGCGGDLQRAQDSYRIGDYPRAKRLFESELDKHPVSFDARYGYSVVLQEISLKRKSQGEDQIEDWKAVIDQYEICSRLGETESFSENYAISLFHLANKLYLDGKFLAAQQYLDQARRLEPKNKFVLNLAGIVEYSQAKYKEAQETFEFLIALDPEFVSAYLNLGNVLWESGQEDAALVTWKQALTLSPNNQAIIDRLESALKKISEN